MARRSVRGGWGRGLTAALLSAGVAVGAIGIPAAAPAVAADSAVPEAGSTVSVPSQETAETLAVAEARRTGKPVEVEALRGESSDVVA
ncbi:hypothetical protein ACIQF6_26845, partial [Kitasatospora sp. NPDC092948]